MLPLPLSAVESLLGKVENEVSTRILGEIPEFGIYTLGLSIELTRIYTRPVPHAGQLISRRGFLGQS